MRQDHRLGIEALYDVLNEFYALILDRKYMFYSCADFHSATDTIEVVQTRTTSFRLKLIAPKAGESTLDLGCGWGGMLRRIDEETGDRKIDLAGVEEFNRCMICFPA